jgi:hypothetical protein
MQLIGYYVKEKYTLRYTGGMVPDVNQVTELILERELCYGVQNIMVLWSFVSVSNLQYQRPEPMIQVTHHNLYIITIYILNLIIFCTFYFFPFFEI